MVHEGFAGALDGVWKHIAPVLADLEGPVFYAGHSLGAALATLAAVRRAPAAVYTFGSPRVGDARFAAAAATLPIYRVVDDADLVATVPPEQLGFSHAGELHRIVPKLGPFRLSLLVWLQRLIGPAKPLADHAPINYVDRIH
jgi:triacylglycerol lipase